MPPESLSSKTLSKRGQAMPNSGLFVGFGNPVRGREAKSLEVFNTAMQYYSRLQQEGTIESWEVAFLEPHGGDLGGFFLLKGDRDRLSRLRAEPEFNRLTMRAAQITEGLGVVGAWVGEGVTEALNLFQEAIEDL